MRAAQRNLLGERDRLRRVEETLAQVQRLLLSSGSDVADAEINRLIDAVNPTKEFLKSNPDIFENNKYDTGRNTIDCEYREARMAWYQYTGPDTRSWTQKLARWARQADPSNPLPYPVALVDRFCGELNPASNARIDQTLRILTVRAYPHGFKIFIKREVMRTAEAFLRQADTRLHEAVHGRSSDNEPLPLYSATDPSGSGPSGSGS